jgi:hypothetical protein
MFSQVTTQRIDLTVGIASIFLCLIALEARGRRPATERWLPPAVALAMVGFFLVHGFLLRQLAGEAISLTLVIGVSLVAGVASWLLVAGWRRSFCTLVGTAVALTGVWFNPLATDLDHIYGSEMARAVRAVEESSPPGSVWLCYGGVHPGVLVEILGGRTLSGVYWPPQPALWDLLDPDGVDVYKYNRFLEVSLTLPEADDRISIGGDHEASMLDLGVAPTLPLVRELGARHVLALAESQARLEHYGLKRVYQSTRRDFSIFELD